VRELEDNVLNVAIEVLESRASDLARAGLTYSVPEIEFWERVPGRYESEVRVAILKGGKVEHVLEAHIYKEGRAMVTVEEARASFEERLGALAAALPTGQN
jgi:hypothetical protein